MTEQQTARTEFIRYQPRQSYAWNYERAPRNVDGEVAPPLVGTWTLCGRPVGSPLGIAAGPLLNGRWAVYYSRLGYDVLTYKTVRSVWRECYPLPNLVPVDCITLTGDESHLQEAPGPQASWAVSFGMPSQEPDVWRRDIEWTRQQLARHQLLSVSVVGTMQPGWGLNELADDYARCAAWAVASGADCVEANLSCPNVTTRDGQLYQQPEDAGCVGERIRGQVGTTPLIAKVGHVTDPVHAESLLERLDPWFDAVALTNSVAARVVDREGRLLFDGQPRGICGAATRSASIAQVRMFREIAQRRQFSLQLIGVGGVGSSQDVQEYLAAGAQAIQMATAAMHDPALGLRLRKELA